MPKPRKPAKRKPKPSVLDLTTKKPGRVKVGREIEIEEETMVSARYKPLKKGKIKVE